MLGASVLIIVVLWNPLDLGLRVEEVVEETIDETEALLGAKRTFDLSTPEDQRAHDADLVQRALAEPVSHVAAELLRAVSEPATTEGWTEAASAVASSRAPSLVLRGHLGRIDSLDLSPNGDTLLSSADDGTVRVWSIAGHHDPVVIPSGSNTRRSAVRLPDGRGILTIDQQAGGVQIWTFTGDGPEQLLPSDGQGTVAAAGSDGSLFVGREDGSVLRLSSQDAAAVDRLRQGRIPITSMDLAPDGSWLAVADSSAHVRLYAPDGQRIRTVVSGDQGGEIVSFAADGAHLMTYSTGASTVRLWSAETTRFVGEVAGLDGAVTTAGFTPDGARLFVGTDGGSVALWDVGAERIVQTWGDSSSAVQVAAMNEGSSQLALARSDGTAELWEAEAETPPYILDTAGVPSSEIIFSADDSLLIVGGMDGVIRVWQTGRTATPASPNPTTEELHHQVGHHSVRCLDAHDRMQTFGESHAEAKHNAHACRAQRTEQARTDHRDARAQRHSGSSAE
jgi:WD40 repeat protein